jgi:hypothetical protein
VSTVELTVVVAIRPNQMVAAFIWHIVNKLALSLNQRNLHLHLGFDG